MCCMAQDTSGDMKCSFLFCSQFCSYFSLVPSFKGQLCLRFPGKGLKKQTRKVMRKKTMRPSQSLHGSYSPFKSGRMRQQLGWTYYTPEKVQGTPLSHLGLSPNLLRNLLLLQPCLLARPDGVKRIQQCKERSPTVSNRRSSELLPVSSRGSSRQSFYCLSSGAVSVFVFIFLLSLWLSPY